MANPRAAVLGFAAGVTAALLLGLCAWRHGRIKLMSDKKDDRVLLGKLIRRCIERGGATEEELRAQRRSWVSSEAAWGSDADEAAYRDAYDRGDTEEITRLDAAAEKRRQAALKRMDEHDG